MKKKLIIIGIALLIVIIGIIMTLTIKFNRSLEYGKHTALDVYMTEATNLDDIRQIVQEIFDGEYKVEYTDEFSDTVSIKLRDVSEEQLTQIKDKLIEKYNFPDETNYIIEINVPAIRIFDIVKEYIAPIAISLVVILIYYGIDYRKLGVYQSVIEPLLIIIMIGALYVSAFAIFRIPINEYTVPIGILIYISSLLGTTSYLNSKKS